MKLRLLLFILLGLGLGPGLLAQNPPSFGRPADSTLLVGSGQNFIVLPSVDDGDEGVDQEISFQVVSGDPDVLEVLGVNFEAGQTMALLQLSEKGVLDTVQLRIEASDADGSMRMDLEVVIKAYDKPGINFEVHDSVFWQEEIPLSANPAFSMIAPDGEAPYGDIDLEGLELLVYSDCSSEWCTGTDFFTAFFKGWLKPTVSGDYTFYMEAGDRHCIGLSTDESFDNIEHIIYKGSERPEVGSSAGNKEVMSVPVSMEAGKLYAIYGAHWNIHTLLGGMRWEGPGISKEFIPGTHMSYVHDVVKPDAPGDFALVSTGVNDVTLSWSAASDDVELAGYRLYLDGMPVNADPLVETTFEVTGLEAARRYCLMVSSLDKAGNESVESQVLCATTYGSDDQPPLPPTTVEASVVSDLALALQWSGASDAETEIRGYWIYLDGEPYGDELVRAEEAVISGLLPEQEYLVSIEAVDAGYNVSVPSATVSFTTRAFDPLDARLTDKKARLRVWMDPVGRSEGIGVNVNYKNGEFLNDPEQIRLIREHASAAIRWGALTANPLNFSDYMGVGKDMTIARFMNACNEADAYTVFTCGVEDATDWRQNPQTFVNFLEYLAGPAESTYGAKRVAEGFTEPLLSNSQGLIFEFGNEVWGGSSHSAQIGSNYTTYGTWCREMASLMKASEYYDSTKIKLVYSGRYPNSEDSYGLHEKLLKGDRGEVDWLALSGYMGGNLDYSPEIDPGDSELEYYQNGFAYMNRRLDGLMGTMDLVLDYSGHYKPSYFYEANMTTPAYYGKLGQAIAQTDYYAMAVERGGAIPTVFHLTNGQWKMTVPSQDYKKLPIFLTTQYYNRYCTGNVLKAGVETLASVPNYEGAAGSLDPLSCHAYASDTSMSILLLSRDFEHAITVQVDLPDSLQLIAPEKGVKILIGGEGFSSNEAQIDSVDIGMQDSLLVELPPHSMVLLHFGADMSSVEDAELGSFLDYTPATDIEIFPYGSSDFDIVGSRKKTLRVNVSPEDVWSDAVQWTVHGGEVEVNAHLESYGFVVEGSRTCAGNGTVTVRATAWDNPAIYHEVEINISEQGTDCNVGLESGTLLQPVLHPNPAGESLRISGLPAGKSRIEVLDQGGRSLLTGILEAQETELDLGSLQPGMYFLRILRENDTKVVNFVKQ